MFFTLLLGYMLYPSFRWCVFARGRVIDIVYFLVCAVHTCDIKSRQEKDEV